LPSERFSWFGTSDNTLRGENLKENAMTPDVRPLVAGNWKMNGLLGSLGEVEAMRRAADAGEAGAAELVICPPATLLAQAAWKLRGGKLALGGQDCAVGDSGAFTGDISAPMLKDAGASYVIVGHSERRTYHHETDELVSAKAAAALRAGLVAIVCVGETLAERDAGQQAAVVIRQLRRSLPPGGTPETVVIAYEPVWAIGTGRTPTPGDIAAVHNGIRALLTEVGGPSKAKTRILYGGSVKATNCQEILTLDNIDGALVGGASLKAADFLAIAVAYR
jgi:triosephosphate isomerase